MRRIPPLAALIEGMIAGAIGAGVQTLFFRATKKIAPGPPPNAFSPPEPAQREEQATQTIARRLVEDVAERGPLTRRQKARLGTLVHYGFGAALGGLYGLIRGSRPSWWSVAGVAGFSAAAWMIGDNLILPALRLSAWPQRYPLKNHLYALSAHLVYGSGVAGTLVVADRVID